MATSNERPKILLVDNEKDTVVVLRHGLEKHDYTVEGFTDPKEALTNFKKQHYSLIILDIRMPGMTGLELSREIIKIDNEARIGFLTALESDSNEVEAVFSTVKPCFFMRKPLMLQEVLEQVRKYAFK